MDERWVGCCKVASEPQLPSYMWVMRNGGLYSAGSDPQSPTTGVLNMKQGLETEATIPTPK